MKKHSFILMALIVPIAMVLSGCANPDAMSTRYPSPPFQDPNILGIERTNSRSLATIDDALACLASSHPVYAITAENSNVRPNASVGDCRVGRIPQGRLIRVDAIYESDGTEALVSLDRPFKSDKSNAIGYVEDVQPIFERACIVCHSGIVQMNELQVTEYDPLMAGSINGPVIVPGKLDESFLWEQVSSNRMPMIGELSPLDKETIRLWIEAGAPERRSGLPDVADLWLSVDSADVDAVSGACAGGLTGADKTLINAELALPINCAAPPAPEIVEAVVSAIDGGGAGTDLPLPVTAKAATAAAAAAATKQPDSGPVYASGLDAGVAGIQASSLGLAAPGDDDGWLDPQGGFCIERRRPDNDRSITSITFAPDGRMFLALDTPPTGGADPLILYDAHHPSRSIAVYDYQNDTRFQEIFDESTRITGLDYADGALYITRAGEVGRIPDGGDYEPLAGGFAVNSQLFHANNGIVVSNGYVYVSAGGVMDGYSDGPIVGIPESAAQNVVSGGNPFAARIVRAPLSQLLSERSINAFRTAARGVRNPYGITVDPAGRIWFTDNGATNTPENISAGDEVNALSPGAITDADGSSPYYGFPLALNGSPPEWYTDPIVALPDTAAPTGITWAYNTIFYGQYGKDPGLYRLGQAPNGQVISERIMLAWPVLATATAPDGALWVGMGTGELYRMTPGCGN